MLLGPRRDAMSYMLDINREHMFLPHPPGDEIVDLPINTGEPAVSRRHIPCALGVDPGSVAPIGLYKHAVV